MTRKEILLFQLREVRNEFADALAGVQPGQLTARPIPGRNPIGWIASHCMHNFSFFLYERQVGESLVAKGAAYDAPANYDWDEPPAGVEPPDPAELAKALDEVIASCVALVEALPDPALDDKAPYWHHDSFESVAGNCVRVINHSNAHLRQVWMLRGALGDSRHWPTQTLYKLPGDGAGRFYVPDRQQVLADRAARAKR